MKSASRAQETFTTTKSENCGGESANLPPAGGAEEEVGLG